MAVTPLERVIQRGQARLPAEPDACGMCNAPVEAEHRHLLDTRDDRVLCMCRACGLLFDRDAASNGHYRLIPQRRVQLHSIDPGRLGVPVGLAFFVVAGGGEVEAHYPSPAGATRWEVDVAAWQAVVQDCPELADLAPQVEALLVDTRLQSTGDTRRRAWLVPVDDCFRLVAIVRQEWRGLTGGDRVRPAIERFFDELRSS
jgi:hypothetical protein